MSNLHEDFRTRQAPRRLKSPEGSRAVEIGAHAGPTGAQHNAIEPENPFYCSAEWHLSQMKSRLTPLLYTWARRLSKKSGMFSASAVNVAEYFKVDHRTALRALEELANSGFFQIIHYARFQPSIYKVVDHDEWAKSHPGQCIEKISMPWDGEGDPLGRELFAISGQRAKFLPNQMTGLRNLGFTDTAIVEHFRNYLSENYPTNRRGWYRIYFNFYDYLAAVANETTGAACRRSTPPGPPHTVVDRRTSVSSPLRHRSTPSSRSESSNVVGESELTIPAARVANGPVNRFSKEKKANPSEEAASVHRFQRFVFPKTLTGEGLDARIQMLQEQAREMRRRDEVQTKNNPTGR